MWSERTPIYPYRCAALDVLVKRDDLYAGEPAPPLAKLRGVRRHLEHWSGQPIAAFDTRVSKAGWGVAAICAEHGWPCTVYYPRRKGLGDGAGESQRRAAELGADLFALPAGRTAIVYAAARVQARARGEHLLPLGLTLPETVTEVAAEMRRVRREAEFATLVVSVGTGTILSGLLAGLDGRPVSVWGITAGMSAERVRRRVAANLGGLPPLQLVVAGDYYTPAEGEAPFPCHPYYDLKAWRWLETWGGSLAEPVLFWNIGA